MSRARFLAGGLLVVLLLAARGGMAQPGHGRGQAASRSGAGLNVVQIGRYRLRLHQGDSYLVETESFIARIARDGSVSFRDLPRLPGPLTWPIVAATQIAGAASAGGGQAAGEAAKQVLGRPTLTVSEDDVRRDPHHPQKMDFLAETARFREGLRRTHDRAALAGWQRRMNGLAGDRGTPAAQRRQTLFQLWQECEDSPAGEAARRAIEAAIRAHLPIGSADGFTVQQLARLNAGRPEAQRFRPYQIEEEREQGQEVQRDLGPEPDPRP